MERGREENEVVSGNAEIRDDDDDWNMHAKEAGRHMKPNGKRNRTSVTTERNGREELKKRKRWAASVVIWTESKLRLTVCCRTHQCFSIVDTVFLHHEMDLYLQIANQGRCRTLRAWLGRKEPPYVM